MTNNPRTAASDPQGVADDLSQMILSVGDPDVRVVGDPDASPSGASILVQASDGQWYRINVTAHRGPRED